MPPEGAPTDRGPIADPRLRILALVLTAFGFSTLHAPAALALMVLATLALAWMFDLGPGALAHRLRWPGLAVGGLVAVLPFASGETVLARVGPLALHAEGLEAALGIALRFLCILAAAAALLGTLPVPRLVAALRALGLPALMADMALLMLRHVEDLRRDLARMRTAMRVRGAPPGFWRGQFGSTGRALASLLLRSHARSERIYHAMILRGHGAPGAVAAPFHATRRDAAWLAALAGAMAALLALEHGPWLYWP